MTRVGMNPARHRKTSYTPARVTVAVLIYLPHLSGYFQHRFEVVKLCLQTILANTQEPYDLLVFDNASCQEVKAYLRQLQDEGVLRYWISSSENIGKLGALRVIAGAAPGELIAYSDDDTFFYPGWLRAHLEVFDAFPNVGMVSGSPERTLFDHGIESNLAFAEREPGAKLSYGQTIPEQWERQWGFALGHNPDAFWQEVRGLQDITLEYKGQRAYATACHNQFLMPKEVALRFLGGQWSGRLMGGLNELDTAIAQAGYLRLTTPDRVARLIGNVVTPEMEAEAARFGIQVRGVRALPVARRRARFLRWKPVRWLLQGLYNRLFWLLSEQKGDWIAPREGGQG
jgi:hypothetical protein